jgi:hypothetical protein
MNASTQSQPSTNKPLPKTQQSLLWKLERFPSLLIWDQSSVAKTAKVLAKKGMIAGVAQGDGFTRYTLVKVEAPIATEEAASEDELSAKMPLAPLMDADTAPVMDVVTVTPAYAANDHVTFNYFRDPNYKDEVYQGRIMERAFDRLCGWMYRIDPAPCAFHLSPRWISERYVRTTLTGEMVATIVANDHVSALYDAMTMAEQVYMDYARLDTFDMPADHATFKRKVAAHITYLRAKQAYTGVRSDAMITYLYGAQNAPQTPHNGPSAVVDDVQAFSSNLDQRKPEIAAEPFAPVNATNDHPLALIQPGSEASKTDWDAQQAKRDAQHAEAKARVEALNGVYQAPVRKGIQMHSPEYLNQIFKQAHAK